MATCFAFIILLTIGSVEKANATDWERLPDGRVAIDIKGIRFALPANGNNLNIIRFNAADPERVTLPDVLTLPDKCRAIFDSQPDTNIGIYWVNRPGLYLGHFERTALSGVDLSFHVGGQQGNCSSWAKVFERAKAADPAGQRVENGWRESTGDGYSRVYIHDRGSRGDLGAIPALYCNPMEYCGSSICLGPNLSFVFIFPRVKHPQSEWVELLKTVNDVLNYVIPELPPSARMK